MINWQAHYTDGSTLSQLSGYTYADIDRERLQAFDLWQDNRLLIRVDLRDDSDKEVGRRRLIYRLRTQMNSSGQEVKFYMVGWQRTVSGRNIVAINYLFEDGAILLGGQFTNDELMDAIVPFPWERDLVTA